MPLAGQHGSARQSVFEKFIKPARFLGCSDRALYPDPLLAQTLAASTYPLEIIQLGYALPSQLIA